MTAKLYDVDFSKWAVAQADHLRNEEYAELDLNNLIEEIEAMAKRDRRELASCIREILLHLLKWNYQPARRSSSWTTSIDKQRNAIEPILDDSPSLRQEMTDMLSKEYPRAVREAAKATRIDKRNFPVECPWSLEQVLDFDFLSE